MKPPVFTVVPFQCIVVENGARCKSLHGEDAFSPAHADSLKFQRFLCQNCQDKGYAWLTDLMSTPELTDEVLQDPKGARTDFMLVKPDKGYELDPVKKAAGDRARQALTGWGVVQMFEDDTLMLRSSEAQNPGDPTISRRLRTIAGFAKPAPKEKDPFGGKLD